jgi:hypothetical protein
MSLPTKGSIPGHSRFGKRPGEPIFVCSVCTEVRDRHNDSAEYTSPFQNAQAITLSFHKVAGPCSETHHCATGPSFATLYRRAAMRCM